MLQVLQEFDFVTKDEVRINKLLSVILVLKLNNLFLGYFDPINIVWIIKIHDFQVTLPNTSAKKTSLHRL